MEVFSKAGKNISWNQFSQQLDESRQKYEQNEAGIRAMAEAADELQIIMKSLMGEVARGVGEDLKLMIDYLKEMANNTSIVGDVFRTVFETVLVIGSDIAFVFGRIAGAFDRFKLGIFASGEEVSAFWAKYNKESEEARSNLDKFQNKVLDNTPKSQKGSGSGGDGGGAGAKRVIEETKKNQAMLKAAEMLSEEYRQQQAIQLQQLAIAGQMVGMTQNEAQIQQAINSVIKSTQASVDSINKKRADAVNANAGTKVIAEYDAQIAKIYEMQDTFIEMSRNVAEATIATQMTFEFGWNKAFKQYAEDAENYGKLAEDMFSSFTNNMNSAIDKFVETGKFSFADFTQSVLKDLIKIQMRMLAMQMFSKAIGMVGGFFGGGATEVSAITTSTGAYADGGDPPVGKASLVGERGPELFIPKRAGTIVPNHQLKDAMGGGGGGTIFNGPVIQNMSAIDTQSGLQFLAKNKMAVWSANQSASRSVPTSR
jgi:lambda family phage tail tape measure protein